MSKAVEKARVAGIFIVSSSIGSVYGFKFQGLGHNPMADPDNFNSYEPGLWWAEMFYQGNQFQDKLLIPMDSRTVASFTGIDEYVFYREGGWSWSIPYIAGLYALAAQVDNGMTPDKFWTLAMKTGHTIEINNGGNRIRFGPILDAVKLIDTIKAE